jgi:DMSO/TMAO reductase YedYZ molybdopterin-dependent catalytic subunit
MATRVSSGWLSQWSAGGGQDLLSRRMWLAAVAPILRGQGAEVSNFDFSLLDEGPTPADLFFVREHFPPPSVSSADWKLSIRGAVSAPVEISFDELAALPHRLLPVTVECAENPAAGGLISHAEWSGVSLASLLEKARPGVDARFVRLSGADGFARSIPLAKAMHTDTLLAHQMNGEKLSVKHGFPLRAVVPGWYGMDSIKWLRGIEVLAGEPPEQGYQRQVRSLLTGTQPAGPVTAMNVKSAFSRPLDGAILAGKHFTVRGAAWAGENRVRQVEVSLDGGRSWQPARLLSPPRPYNWVYWAYEWKIKSAGEYELSVRAADDQGRQQPSARASERVDAYESNPSQIVKVTVT